MVARAVWAAAVTVLVLLLSSGCTQIAEIENREEQSDFGIRTEMNVKTALLNADGVWGAAIRAVYMQDEIHLRGFVANEEERRRALEAARRAEPDVPVVDELEIWTLADD